MCATPGSEMNLAFSFTAAAIAAACGWPAAGVAARFARASGSPAVPGPVSEPRRAATMTQAQAGTATVTALITAALVALATLQLHQELLATACGWLVICGLPLAIIDIRVRRLPDALTAACAAGILVLLTARRRPMARARKSRGRRRRHLRVLRPARAREAGLGRLR
ncbi:MAG TPA: hypothetical protein VMA73_03720 [Streptosporangiaceae bacterium]|nr:hypothetical protein [Streptosporangiaceae bacterium]